MKKAILPRLYPRRAARGYTLAELAIVLSIVAVLFGAVWIAVSTVWTNYRFKRVVEQTLMVAGDMRETYGGIGFLPDGVDPVLQNDANAKGLIPRDLREDPAVNNGVLRHALGGQMQIQRFAPLDRVRFRIHILGLSQEACVRLLPMLPFREPSAGFVSVQVNNSGPAVNIHNIAQPFNPANPDPSTPTGALGLCNSLTDNEVALGFTLLR